MTPTILNTIAAHAKERVAADKAVLPLGSLRETAEACPTAPSFPFESALAAPEVSFICEVKRASPSKGMIAEDFPYMTIATDYEAAGAACISVLTEPKWFLGHDDYLRDIRSAVSVPLLRKDFTVDEYQIYQAKLLGADAVLLICALLDQQQLRDYIQLCDTLGLSALVEAHDETELSSAAGAGARIIGVNNRNLKDFTVDLRNSLRLRELVDKDTLFVAESGMKTAADIALLREGGVNGVLIGESLMRAPDKKQMLSELRGDTL
ncbi:Indole-3-glycerol phosphate synthase [uncultured Eubacteriales bacterium]|uniref:Indole-3-glycerol phosphate synthase n=1 Tax=uncultured Eubacteriales bacterium TaxID=172733 RepID=A0A212KBZ0_9FIRM|nr:Indole-3-glycerol phosphate synthase [uncultured Eubacteriales bacterium]